MTPKETQKYIREMKAYTKEVNKSIQKSKEFLHKTGVYTQSGNLTKNYK